MRLNRDAESICRANQGLAAVQGAVKERNLKYQELIAGERESPRRAQPPTAAHHGLCAVWLAVLPRSLLCSHGLKPTGRAPTEYFSLLAPQK